VTQQNRNVGPIVERFVQSIQISESVMYDTRHHAFSFAWLSARFYVLHQTKPDTYEELKVKY